MGCKWLLAPLAMALGVGAALAGAGGGLKGIGGAGANVLVHKVHGCHETCDWAPGRGWHRHVGAQCKPVWCEPEARQPIRCWVDGRGVRRCLW